jgi:hypothetical protein
LAELDLVPGYMRFLPRGPSPPLLGACGPEVFLTRPHTLRYNSGIHRAMSDFVEKFYADPLLGGIALMAMGFVVMLAWQLCRETHFRRLKWRRRRGSRN